MRSFCKRALAAMTGLGMAVMTTAPAYADVGVGDTAPLFDTVNEDMDPVSMAELIDGRPLVLAVGSAT
jgi:hypothetical protein